MFFNVNPFSYLDLGFESVTKNKNISIFLNCSIVIYIYYLFLYKLFIFFLAALCKKTWTNSERKEFLRDSFRRSMKKNVKQKVDRLPQK